MFVMIAVAGAIAAMIVATIVSMVISIVALRRAAISVTGAAIRDHATGRSHDRQYQT